MTEATVIAQAMEDLEQLGENHSDDNFEHRHGTFLLFVKEGWQGRENVLILLTACFHKKLLLTLGVDLSGTAIYIYEKYF